MTALAFGYFASRKVDIAIVEVGLGGRLDATNVLTPLLTVTTDISFDHMEILGRTLRRIAAEKAGIIKPGIPHVIGHLPRPAVRVMRETAHRRHAPLVPLIAERINIDKHKVRLQFTGRTLSLSNVRPALAGLHQLQNAAVALHSCDQLRLQGLKLPVAAIRNGLKQAVWPGRFQIIRRKDRPTTILDVGHNAGGVRAFVQSFRTLFPERTAHVIVGFVQRKEHQAMFDSLRIVAREYFLVPMKTHRSVPPAVMEKSVDFKGVLTHRCGSLEAAVRSLERECSQDDIIVVIGSHYLVGEYIQSYGH